MMDRKKKLYKDILDASTLIQQFTSDITSFSQYTADIKTKSAVERQLSIIGEALTKLRKLDIVELVNIKQIIGLRNLIIHSYDTVDDKIIWAIIQNHIAPLKQEVADRLN